MIDPNNVRLDLYNNDGIETARLSLLSDPTVGVHYRAIGKRDDILALGMILLKVKIRKVHDQTRRDISDYVDSVRLSRARRRRAELMIRLGRLT